MRQLLITALIWASLLFPQTLLIAWEYGDCCAPGMGMKAAGSIIAGSEASSGHSTGSSAYSGSSDHRHHQAAEAPAAPLPSDPAHDSSGAPEMAAHFHTGSGSHSGSGSDSAEPGPASGSPDPSANCDQPAHSVLQGSSGQEDSSSDSPQSSSVPDGDLNSDLPDSPSQAGCGLLLCPGAPAPGLPAAVQADFLRTPAAFPNTFVSPPAASPDLQGLFRPPRPV